MKRILLFIVLCMANSVFAQDVNPEFVGGPKAMFAFVKKNYVFPADEKNKNLGGDINVQFEVTKKGNLKDIKVLKGLSSPIDNEIIRVFESMPTWKPAVKNEKSVSKVIDVWVNVKPLRPVIKEVYDIAIDDYEEESEPRKTGKAVIHDVVAKSPEFPGGQDSMHVFIEKNFVYPAEAISNNESGTIWVEFVVMSDGTIATIKVVKGVSTSLNAEAVRIVGLMPKWKPGEQAGKVVSVRYIIPIKAKLPQK